MLKEIYEEFGVDPQEADRMEGESVKKALYFTGAGAVAVAAFVGGSAVVPAEVAYPIGAGAGAFAAKNAYESAAMGLRLWGDVLRNYFDGDSQQ